MLNYVVVIMEEHGFDTANNLPDGVLLNNPPFKRSRPQLTAEETADRYYENCCYQDSC